MRRDGSYSMVCNSCGFVTMRKNLNERECTKCKDGWLRVKDMDERMSRKWVSDAQRDFEDFKDPNARI